MNKNDLYKLDAIEIYKLLLTNKIKRFPAGFWQLPEAQQNAVKVTKFLINDILHYNLNDVKNKLTRQMFFDNKLQGMLRNLNCDIFTIIKKIYNDIEIWEIKKIHVNPNYWKNEKNISKAIKWILKRKKDKSKITFDDFYNYGISTIISHKNIAKITRKVLNDLNIEYNRYNKCDKK